MTLRSVTAKRVARQRAWPAIRQAVYDRDNGRCLLCDEHVPFLVVEIHHRLLKSRGGLDDHPNLVTTCARCHHDRIHAFPIWATSVGFMVPSWVKPPDWPVLVGVYGAGWLEEARAGNPMLWQVPDLTTGAWTVRAPHEAQDPDPAPWIAA